MAARRLSATRAEYMRQDAGRGPPLPANEPGKDDAGRRVAAYRRALGLGEDAGGPSAAAVAERTADAGGSAAGEAAAPAIGAAIDEFERWLAGLAASCGCAPDDVEMRGLLAWHLPDLLARGEVSSPLGARRPAPRRAQGRIELVRVLPETTLGQMPAQVFGDVPRILRTAFWRRVRHRLQRTWRMAAQVLSGR
jgi:hypothetical protein